MLIKPPVKHRWFFVTFKMMENKEEIIEVKYDENEKTRFYWWGVTFLLLGGAYFMVSTCMFLYEYTTNINWVKSHLEYVKNAIEIIVSGSGLCASLAGVFYVLDNLTLQRKAIAQQQFELQQNIKENRESNKHYETQSRIMRLQQYDNTFFNLLNNQKSLLNNLVFSNLGTGEIITGSSALVYIVNKMNKYMRAYKHSLNNQFFASLTETSFNQIEVYYKFEVLSSVTDNIIHIIEYIIYKLENSEFHHKTFYCNLTNEEKFIIGLVLKNKLINFSELKFDYTEYYMFNSTHTNSDNDIPSCNIAYSRVNKIDNCIVEETTEFENKIRENTGFTFVPDKIVNPVRLEGKYCVQIYGGFGGHSEIATLNENFNSEIPSTEFDMYFIFKEHIYSIFKSPFYSSASSFVISITQFSFYFIYNSKEYGVFIPDVTLTVNKDKKEIGISYNELGFYDDESPNLAF